MTWLEHNQFAPDQIHHLVVVVAVVPLKLLVDHRRWIVVAAACKHVHVHDNNTCGDVVEVGNTLLGYKCHFDDVSMQVLKHSFWYLYCIVLVLVRET